MGGRSNKWFKFNDYFDYFFFKKSFLAIILENMDTKYPHLENKSIQLDKKYPTIK